MKRLSIWSTIVLLLVALTATSQTKVVVLSDIHVMAPELLVNDGKAFQDHITSNRKVDEFSRELFDVMVDRLKNSIKPDWLFITGDLTKDGERLSHEYVAAKLGELRQAGIRTLIVPGNHDWGTDNALYYDGDETRPAERASGALLEQLYGDYGLGSQSERFGTTLNYVTEPVEGLTVIGIDSGTEGVLSSEALDWVCNKASEAFGKGQRVIALMHHALIPHITGAEKLPIAKAVISDYETVRNRLADAGVSAVFTGHLHFTDNAKDFNADLTESIYDIATGALETWPSHYRIMTLSSDLKELSLETYRISTLPSTPDFDSRAKQRLENFIENKLRSVSSGGTLMKTAMNIAVPLAQEAVVAYASGNEHQNSDAADLMDTFNNLVTLANLIPQVNSMLSEYGLTMTDVKNAAHSVLENKTSCGITGRETVVDDLSLTIPLRAKQGEETAIRTLEPDRTMQSDDAFYTLQGFRIAKPVRTGLYIRNGRLVLIGN